MRVSVTRVGAMSVSHNELDKLFTEVLTFQHANERSRRVLNTLGNCLPVFELSGRDPSAQFRESGRPDIQAIRYDKSLHQDAIRQDGLKVIQAVRPYLVVLRNEPAQRDARERIEQRNYRFEDLAADIFEVDIDSARNHFL